MDYVEAAVQIALIWTMAVMTRQCHPHYEHSTDR